MDGPNVAHRAATLKVVRTAPAGVSLVDGRDPEFHGGMTATDLEAIKALESPPPKEKKR